MKKLINKEIIKYIIVGTLTTFVSLFTYYLCVITFLNPKVPVELQIANIISWICAVLFAYFANRKYVFKSKEKNIIKEGSNFVSSRIITLLLEMLTMFVLVTILNVNDKLGKLLTQIIILIGNYIISKFYVFKK